MILPDYKYLDTNKVESYLSRLPTGAIEALKETDTSTSGKEGGGGIAASLFKAEGKVSSAGETSREKTIRISYQRMFHQLYEALKQEDAITIYDEHEPVKLENLRKGTVVEVARDFELSPVNDLVESLLKIMSMGDEPALGRTVGSQEERQKNEFVKNLLQGDPQDKEIPMISTDDEEGPTVVFLAKNRYIIPNEELDGEVTVFGKVDRILPQNSSLDLIDLMDLFKALPRRLRRSSFMTDMKRDLLEKFQSFPDSLGGPIDEEKFVVHGPAIVVSPVAVYTP
jgi:hypothetical protein